MIRNNVKYRSKYKNFQELFDFDNKRQNNFVTYHDGIMG